MAHAQAGTAVVRPSDGQGALPVWALGTLESHGGEDQLAFLKRAGRLLNAYTERTGYEACGVIGERRGQPGSHPGRWVLPLVTQKAHIACMPALTLPEDAVYTGETIHSHPSHAVRRYRPTAADRTFLQMLEGRRVALGQTQSVRTLSQRFSEQDYKAGPGWLVVDGALYHQRGSGTLRAWGAVTPAQPEGVFPDPAPMPSLPGLRADQIAWVDLSDLGLLPTPVLDKKLRTAASP